MSAWLSRLCGWNEVKQIYEMDKKNPFHTLNEEMHVFVTWPCNQRFDVSILLMVYLICINYLPKTPTMNHGQSKLANLHNLVPQ